MNKNDSNEKSAILTPTLQLPKGGGALKGIGETFQPDAFSGTAHYSIAVPTTPARGFEPRLSIDYNSGNGNSPFGIGFSLSVPKISVRTEKGIPQYDGNDIFLRDGRELVLKSSAEDNGWKIYEYCPRVESSFDLIQQYVKKDDSESYWKITTNENTVSVYGYSEKSRIFNLDNPSQIFEWLIDYSIDSKGNKIEFAYKTENKENVPDKPWEVNRSYNNKYIRSISYGNYNSSIEKSNDVQPQKFAYELVFDYGEYDITNLNKSGKNPYKPVNKWDYRPDSFSSYLSGFEIRTCRLCRNILLFHHFDELKEPCLVKSVNLTYEQNLPGDATRLNNLSIIKQAKLTGYRKQTDSPAGRYDIQETPPVQFNFSQFNPSEKKQFKDLIKELEFSNGKDIPGYLNNTGFQLMDMNGEGISGLFYHDEKTVLYYEPLGSGKYKQSVSRDGFPTDKDFDRGELSLTDLDGNGELELVVRDAHRPGYYQKDLNGKWQPYTPFKSYPTAIGNVDIELASLSNNGKTDALLTEDESILLYPSLGVEGYAPPIRKKKQTEFPSVKKAYRKEYVGFADMMGDGLSHRVKISNGSVECWSDLGYGSFGKKITLGNAPEFGDDFDISRLFLADIDGSGTADILYVSQNKIDLYINKSGNCFSEAISIDLPESYSFIDQIGFSDINGNGTNCLVFTTASRQMKHYYYDFVGKTCIDGREIKSMKPYLLIEIDNNMGTATQIQYAASTKFYLEDKNAGSPWITKLPFPVQVVEKLINIDRITGSRYTSRFKYHDGFYDHVEKEFRGFGYVETWDSETYEAYQVNSENRDFEIQTIDKENFVPPIYTRNWYHTGAMFDDPAVSKNYKANFYKGDKEAYDFPDVVLQNEIQNENPETQRQAYVALKGSVLRTEVYACDKDENPKLYKNPYTVTAANAEVRLLQKIEGNNIYAVFMVNPRESISYQYERNSKDPRIEQSFALTVDKFGNTKKLCAILLQRRQTEANLLTNYLEQNTPLGTLSLTNYVKPLENSIYCHIPCEDKQFEIKGLKPDVEYGYFSFESVSQQIGSAVQRNTSKAVQSSENSDAGVETDLISWNRSYFWDEQQNNQKPLGEISPVVLLHHSERAVFTKQFSTDIFDGKLIDTKAYTGKEYLSNVIYTHGGYFYDTSSGYWWDKGLVEHYLKSDQFYLAYKTENTFAIETKDTKYKQDPSLYRSTSISFDDNYNLFPTTLTQQIDENTENKITAKTDYITSQPYQIEDINGNTTQVLFDALGLVFVTSSFGTENSKPIGGMTLYPEGNNKAEYKTPKDATFKDIIENPEKYLQGAGTYFYYNLDAWTENKQPVSTISLIRNNYWKPLDTLITPDTPFCQQLVSYTDGTGRELEAKVLVDKDRWQVSGRTVYNNKGKPFEQYLPRFSDTPDYEDQKDIKSPPPTVIHYDSLSRVIRVDTPKGFFSKVEFTPWEEKHFDEDDTILDSTFCKNKCPGDLNENEKDAIEKAKKFYNTPAVQIFDNKGSVFLEIENNLGNVSKDAFISFTDKNKSAEIWSKLKANGYISPDVKHPELTFLTPKFQPYKKGFKLNLPPEFNNVLGQIIEVLRQNCLTAYHKTDILGRVTESIDPSLYYSNISKSTDYYNFKYQYPLAERNPAMADSADAGKEQHLSNIFGSQLWSWSARNYCQFICYDRLQRRTQLKIKKFKENFKGPVAHYNNFNLVEVYTYGENQKDARQKNLCGELYELKDLSGILTNNSYTMHGAPLESSRQMLKDYKDAVDWNGSLKPLLEKEIFTSKFTYNAVNDLITETTPDDSVTKNTYNQAGQLKTVSVLVKDSPKPQEVVKNIEYNEKGQRTAIFYGNKVTTKYDYEELTLRLIGIKSFAEGNGRQQKAIQDIEYFYDPVGNITSTIDNTAKIVFHNNQIIKPESNYTYDALYRLTKATGRQHIGIAADTYQNNSPASFKQSFFGPSPSVNDSNKLENYAEDYTYDDSGNLIEKTHFAKSTGTWKRDLAVEDNSNRLKDRSYDASGNLLQINIDGSVELTFNCCENLVQTGIIKRADGIDDADFYMYDANERRTRKVSEKMAHGNAITDIEDKIYLGNYEVKRKRNASGQIISERQTLRIMDDSACVAIIHYMAKDKKMEGLRQFRFQLDNNLGSVSLELDESAKLISYEEYFPYGGTALITGKNETEVKAKEYRYSGKERDDSTGLYYYGARYYAPWLARWLKPDPAGTVDGMNLYSFVGGNPVKFKDSDGLTKRTRGEDPEFDGSSIDEKRSRSSGGSMLSMRSVDHDKANPTKGFQGKFDKKHTIRIHWKGNRNDYGTSGIIPYITTRDSKDWDPKHKASRSKLSNSLAKQKDFVELTNNSSSWAAENSHLIAGSLYGPNDILSAPPASVHQNTEWLAIETGIKKLMEKHLVGEVKIKATGYVHDQGNEKGHLKGARYKIYIGGKKVFDHISLGYRGNIDKVEAKLLKNKVASLTANSSSISVKIRFGTPPNAPTKDEIKKGRKESISTPMFTDIEHNKQKYVKQKAFDHLSNYY